MKRLLLLSLCSLLLFMAAPVRAQAVLTGVRPIADGEGNPVTAVDPLPVSLAGGGFSGDVNLTEVGSVVLSAAAALGDVDTNPTTATFGAAGMVWDPCAGGGLIMRALNGTDAATSIFEVSAIYED